MELKFNVDVKSYTVVLEVPVSGGRARLEHKVRVPKDEEWIEYEGELAKMFGLRGQRMRLSPKEAAKSLYDKIALEVKGYVDQQGNPLDLKNKENLGKIPINHKEAVIQELSRVFVIGEEFEKN